MVAAVNQFYAEIQESLRVCGLLGKSVSAGSAPQRISLGPHQSHLLHQMYNYSSSDGWGFCFVSEGIFEQIATQCNLLSETQRLILARGADPESTAEVLKYADKLLLQLKIMEHNLTLASATNGQTNRDQLEALLGTMEKNKTTFETTMRAIRTAAKQALGDTVLDDSEDHYDQNIVPLTFDGVVIVAKHLIIPALEKALTKLRYAEPGGNEIYKKFARRKYDLLTAAWPEFQLKFKHTGNAYFDTFDNQRLAEAVVATTYNLGEDYKGGGYQQKPLQLVKWRDAVGLDVAGAAFTAEL